MPKRQYRMSQPRTPEQLANLQSFTAPDTNGGTVPVTAKIEQADFDALEALPGDRSAKIRQAIRDYIAKHTNNHDESNYPPQSAEGDCPRL